MRRAFALMLLAGLLPGRVFAKSDAATSGAAPPAVEDLEEIAVIKSLCLATRPPERVWFDGDAVARAAAKASYGADRSAALAKLYRVRLPTEGFRLGEYEEQQGTLALDLTYPLRSLHGALTLAFSGDAPVEFAIAAPQAKEAMAAMQARTATLVTYFELNDDQGAVCTGSAAAGVFTIAALPVVFDLRDAQGNSLARFDTARADRFRALIGGYSGTPEAVLGAIEGENVDAAGVAKRLNGAIEPLRKCYAARLKARPDAGGTVVVGMPIKQGGQVDALTYIADGLGDEPLRHCVDTAFRAVSFAGVFGLPALVRVPVEFRLAQAR